MPDRTSFSLPSLSILLGTGTRGGALDRTRRLQAGELAASRRLALMLHPLVACLLALALWQAVPIPLLLGWIAAVAALSATGLVGTRRSDERPSRLIRQSAIFSAVTGLLWTVPSLVFVRWAGVREIAVLAMLVPGMMAGAAFLLASAPLSALIFVGIAGLGGVALMLSLGSVALALLTGAGTLMAMLANLRHAALLMQRRGIELVLAEREAVVSLLLREFEERADWLWQTDEAKALVEVSDRAAAAFAVPRTELEGRPLLELLAGAGWSSGTVSTGLRDLAERLRLREPFSDLHIPVRIGDDARWWSLAAMPRHDEAGRFTGFQGMASDITERRRSAERIDQMARFDALTGLANRREMMAALSDALVAAHRGGGRATLMILDLDRFKQVNDTLGHPVGDRLLKQVAGRLVETVGGAGKCGRLGGDEFAVICPTLGDGAALDELAEAIIASLSAPYEVDEHWLFIGASVGLATFPRDGRSVETLVRNADLALYRAKDDGRGVHRRYDPRLSARAEERRTIEVALRGALEAGQLHLAYQPIVAAADARVRGFEALLRWRHPELGDVPPDRFVPIAEEARLMGPIGEWVIRTACREAAGWPGPTRLALNLSAGQLHDPALTAILVSALSASGLDPGRLELEVDEAHFLKPGIDVTVPIDRLAAIGVRVSLAGFGTGHASLGYLRRARFSTIKLDRGFVAGAAQSEAESTAIIRAVVAMADSLGMAVTAEGAETERQYAMLRRLGCDQAQGYLFGHPVPPEEARVLAGVRAERRAA